MQYLHFPQNRSLQLLSPESGQGTFKCIQPSWCALQKWQYTVSKGGTSTQMFVQVLLWLGELKKKESPLHPVLTQSPTDAGCFLITSCFYWFASTLHEWLRKAPVSHQHASFLFFFHGALRLQKPYGLLGMGGENGIWHASPGPPPSSHSSWPLTAFSSSLPVLKAQAHQLPSNGDKWILWQSRSRLQFNNTIDWLNIL